MLANIYVCHVNEQRYSKIRLTYRLRLSRLFGVGVRSGAVGGTTKLYTPL